MISRTSCKSLIVFKSAWKRLKWLSILYGVALFLELPLTIWMQLAKQKAFQGSQWAEFANKTDLSRFLLNPLVHLTNIAIPVVLGLILFNYLQNDRAGTFYHSLPIKRGVLYCQNLLAGLTLVWIPLLINGLIVWGIFTAFGVTKGEWVNPTQYDSMVLVPNIGPTTVSVIQAVAGWLLLSLLMTALFYIFTVFIGMLTGNVLLQGALTFIGFFLPMGLYLVTKYNLGRLLYGYPKDIIGKTIESLSPIVNYLSNPGTLFTDWTLHLWYLAITVILCGAGFYLYQKRHTEAAGETLAAEWIRRTFKYGVAICATLTGGLYLSTMDENKLGLLYLGYFIGAILGYIIADMIAYKSFHFYRRWKGLAVFAALFIVLLFSVKLDFFGYQRYIPDQNNIKEVALSNFNRDGNPEPEGLAGEENIRMARKLHQQIIKLENENKLAEISSRDQSIKGIGPLESNSMVRPVDITYLLHNGSKVKRSYNIDILRYRQFLYPIFNTPEAKRVMFSRLFKINDKKIDQININNNHIGKNIRIYKRNEIDEALNALKKDVLNTPYDAAIEGKIPSQAMIEFIPKAEKNKGYSTFNLDYFSDYHNFRVFLTEHGYLDDLFLKPEVLSSIIVRKIGSPKTVELKDNRMMAELLNWCMAEDQGAFTMKQQQPANKEMVEYYGKVIRTNDNPIYIAFDSNSYAQKLLNKIMAEK